MIVSLAEWTPDAPDLTGGGSAVVKNCLARTKESYGPMPALVSGSAVLTARCQGAVGVQDTAGNSMTFAGDASKLYKLGGGGTAWSNVSKAAGYTTASGERWEFAYFAGRVLATNFGDNIQSFTLGSSTLFADLAAGTAPQARHMTTIAKGFVAVANTYDGVTGAAPQRVWWSAFGDSTSWPTPGSNAAAAALSDYNDIQGDHGWCQGIVGNVGQFDAVVFFERAVFQMAYTGGSTYFQFTPAEGARGTPAPGSIAQLGAIVFYLGEDGFYMFDGSTSKPIGFDKVDKYFLADVDQTYYSRISSAVDPQNKMVFWAYAGSGNSSGNPNRILAFNWALQRWTLIDSVNVELVFRALSLGYTLEQLDAAFGTSIDAFNFSLDSRALTGGHLLMSGFDTSHTLATFTGSAMLATVDTQEAQLVPGRRAIVRGVRPITDAGTPSVAVGVRDRTQDSVTWGTAVALDALGNCPQRANSRYTRGRVTMPAGTTWNHISAVDVDAVPEGRR